MSTVITDIHAHVLPGLDDGPGTPDKSEELLEAMALTGTHRVFCTSHFGSPYFEVSLQDISEAYRCITKGMAQRSVSLARGAEVRLSPSLVDIIANGEVPTLGDTDYVLVEVRSDQISSRSLQLVHELKVRGYVPIMAHPERNLELQRNPDKVQDLIDYGLFLQLTAQSLENSNERMSHKLAWRILGSGHATVIASDAHNTTTRPPGLLRAYEAIDKKLGHNVVEKLMENANAIWENTPCSEIKIPKRRGFLSTFFK